MTQSKDSKHIYKKKKERCKDEIKFEKTPNFRNPLQNNVEYVFNFPLLGCLT